jgi:hypothetical protein
MPQYIVTYGTGETQRIDAARVSYDPSEGICALYSEDGREVGWVSISETRSIVLASVLNQTRPTQVNR